MPFSVLRDLGHARWAKSCKTLQDWMSRQFEEHLRQIFEQAVELVEREPKLGSTQKNPDFLIRDATSSLSEVGPNRAKHFRTGCPGNLRNT